MAQQPNCSDTIVVQEFLAFAQQKLDVMDQVSLEQILVTSFTEEQIQETKKVLADTAMTSIRLITRQREGRGKRDLQDIFKAFLENDPDDVPTFVAHNLHKLPPVTFDLVDVTRVLEDLVLLRADITNIQTKLENSEQIVADQQKKWTEVRRKIRRNTSMCGTANSTITTLKAVEVKKYIHLWNMESGAEEVRDYVRQLCPEGICTVEELTPKGSYKSFKLDVPDVSYEKCLSSNVWPTNARIKVWFNLRRPIRESYGDQKHFSPTRERATVESPPVSQPFRGPTKERATVGSPPVSQPFRGPTTSRAACGAPANPQPFQGHTDAK
ncbi:Mutant cadherin [Operophtera brumata]|uniref:Mutant cadherin n=1 Tax=Operophtera brumata TaxID=104452 RepID=A0A0L7LVH8_OPEBR|nr:Mutant cadherin [Operophtera brumata]